MSNGRTDTISFPSVLSSALPDSSRGGSFHISLVFGMSRGLGQFDSILVLLVVILPFSVNRPVIVVQAILKRQDHDVLVAVKVIGMAMLVGLIEKRVLELRKA